MSKVKSQIKSNTLITGTCLMLCTFLPVVILVIMWSAYQGESEILSLSWIPALGINLSLNVDGLSILFASLICGVGTLIQIYSVAYMREKRGRMSFHLYLTLFMLAMLGLVLSNDLVLLFIFWELTTLTSYLLIGFNHEAQESRKNALQALLVTGAGGLALLAGLILMGEMAGSYNLSEMIANKEIIQNHALFTPALTLILCGAFTKSAQFPFHFWLPGAMAAPAPVSAYLHSATMVKAGIYLLARTSPIFGDSELWLHALSITGSITLVWGLILALKQTDIKLIFAYTTVAVLGKITLLLAFNSSYATTAAILLIIAHAFYKAALFMTVGNIDKATGSRDIDKLSGLKPALKITFWTGLIAALSAAGIPPLAGFLSKEYLYKAGLDINWEITSLFVATNALMMALILAAILKPFLGKANKNATKPKAIEQNAGFWIPAATLALASFILPVLAMQPLQDRIMDPASNAINPAGKAIDLHLWQGINTPLMLSALTLVIGGILYVSYPYLRAFAVKATAQIPSGPDLYQRLVDGMLVIAKWQTKLLQQKSLTSYTLLFFFSLALLLVLQWAPMIPDVSFLNVTMYEAAIAVFLSLAAIICICTSSRFLAIASLGAIGFLTTLIFMIYSAPDVANTQLLVEILVVIFLSLIIRHVPCLYTVPRHPLTRRALHITIAALIGVSVTMLLIAITATPLDQTIPTFFAQNSVPSGYGRNVVNVILVDFRAFDTLGEIIVVVIAALAAVSLLYKKEAKKAK